VTPAPVLRTALGRHPYLDGVHDGSLVSDAFTLEIAPIDVTLRNSMTRMVRNAEFDVCEMSPTSYLMARQAGAPLLALPVFTYRMFPLHQAVVRRDSAVETTDDLAGAHIGTRTWAQPTGLWLREILSSFRGQDLKGVTWTFVAEDPVAGVPRPVGSIDRIGETLAGLLASGEIDVAFGEAAVPEGCRRLVDDPMTEAARWYDVAGVIPANHVLVVRDDVADRVDLAEIVRLFSRASRDYAASGRDDDSTIEDLRRVTGLTDPMPQGWAANEAMWGVLVDAMCRQGMLPGAPAAEDVIAALEPA